MTQNEASGSAASRQPPPLCLLLPMGLWCALPDTWANRRGAMIVLRGWRRRAGWPLVTDAYLAQACGEADRRHGHHCWAECEACGADLAALLQRRQKGDTEVVARGAQRGKAPPCWTCPQVLAACRRCWPEQGAPLSAQHMRTAGHPVGFVGGPQVLRRQWAEGDGHDQEPMLLAAWFALAEAGVHARAAAALPVRPLPDLLEAVSPAGTGPEPLVAPAAASVAACEDTLLHGEVAPSKLAQRWHGATGATLLACILSDHGVSLEVIGRFGGVHTTTVMRGLSPLAQVNWQAAVPQGQRVFAGTLAVEAKWVKIAGVWWSLFVAVDPVSGLP
jgi:hypothetical protein